MKISYTGENVKLRRAAAYVNRLSDNAEFWRDVASKPDYDYTSPADLSSREISRRLRASDITVEIGLFTPKPGTYRKTVAVTDPRYPRKFFFNTKKLGRSIASMVNTAVHEWIHNVDRWDDGAPAPNMGHGDNRSDGKENSAPYWIGDLAQRYYASAQGFVPLAADPGEERHEDEEALLDDETIVAEPQTSLLAYDEEAPDESELTIPEYLVGAPDSLPREEPVSDGSEAGMDLLARAMPVDTELGLPRPGLYGTHAAARRFGVATTIAALHETGMVWHERHPRSPVGIGDISKRGGGDISGHVSHELGVDVDIRLQRNDGEASPVRYQDAAYSRALTQELIDVIRVNTSLAVKYVFFNDPDADGVQPYPNHDNHLHVRFHLPGVATAPPVLEREADDHAAVRELQRRLNFWIGRTDSAAPQLAVDGRFGPQTLAAVVAFQRSSGGDADGRVVAATWRLLPRS